MSAVTPNIIDVDIDQLHALNPTIIEQAVDAMLHDANPANRQEGFVFVQVLLQQSMLTLHEKFASYLGLDVDKSPSQHILDIHVSRVPPTLGHFFLTSFFFRNLFDNTVVFC